MRRRTIEEENHWPGFVDALSTIIMVVTFLLIILGIALFAITQSVTKDHSEANALESQSTEGAGADTGEQTPTEESDDGTPDTPERVASLEDQLAEAQALIAALEAVSENVATGSPETEPSVDEREDADAASENAAATNAAATKEGSFRQRYAERLLQEEAVAAETDLTVQSRQVAEEREVVVAPDERGGASAERPVDVTGSDILLTLSYDQRTQALDADAARQVDDFLASHQALLADNKIEIRSFASATTGSVSEAKRRAFFRALTLRNRLLDQGVDPARITTKIRTTDDRSRADRVMVIIKSQN
ncbi:MAG: hypothetical protein ACFB6S_00460 [Geminicoccaceae bacterium]